MSSLPVAPPRKVQARNIDEKKAPPHDLLLTYASSLTNSRLLPLPEWLRAGCPTGRYTGPRPTYQLKFDWSNLEAEGPVAVVCRAVEECFGSSSFPGWRIWIRGDQLVLLMQDFRKEYLRIGALNDPKQSLLENCLLDLLNNMKILYKMPEPTQPANNEGNNAASTLNNAASGPNNAASGPNDAASTLVAPEGSQRRSSRSPSRPLGLDQAPFPRTLPTENIGKPPSRKPSPSPSAAASATSNKASAPPLPASSAGPPMLSKPNSPRPPTRESREKSPRPPPMSPVDPPVEHSPSPPNNRHNNQPLSSRPAPVRRKRRSSKSASPETEVHPQTSTSAYRGDPHLLAPPSPIVGGHEGGGETAVDLEEDEHGARHMSDPENEEAGVRGNGNGDEEGEGDSGNDQTFREASDEEMPSDSEEEEDDYQPNKKRPPTTKAKPFKKGEVVTLDHSEEGSEEEPAQESDTPIFQEPDVGPTLAKRRTKAKAAIAKSQASDRARSTTLTAAKIIPSVNRPAAASSSRRAKRKALHDDHSESAPHRKRTRVQQISGPIPETPESELSASQASASRSRPGTQTDAQTELDTPTPINKRGKRKEESIWDYYYDLSVEGSKNKTCKCRACEKIVKGRSTSSFHDHQRTKCPKLAEAARLGIPGIMCDLPITASQTTIGATTGALIQPYNHKRFLAATMKWIVVSGLPFTTIQNPHLQKAFEAANPAARLQSARTLARRLEDSYDIVSDKVVKHLQSVRSTIHYMHDSWTDTGRKNSYFGIYATYIDDNFEYKEILLRLLHSKGKHSGLRMGNGMFELFHTTCRIATNLGPGTADNASNNRTAADRLAELLSTELLEDHVGADLIGCLCHIANIAALKYLEGASKLTPIDFAYAKENIPEIRVIGETACWNAELEETPTDEDLALLKRSACGRAGGEEVDPHDRNVQRMEEADDDELVEEEDLTDVDADSTPVDMVHQLAVYVHSSPQRMEIFEEARLKFNPDTPKGMLPLKDVVTRWNSKEAAIARVIRLRETVEYVTARARSKKCPRFTRHTFDVLKLLQPTLKIFLNLTEVYSEVGANSYRIIPDLIHAIDQLEEIHKHPSIGEERRKCVDGAVGRLQKYLDKFATNPWVCAAFALDPTVREEGLSQLMNVEYEGAECFVNTLKFIKDRVKVYQDGLKGTRNPREEEVKWVKKHARVNKFATSRFQAGHQEVTHNVNDPWECYNSEMKRFETLENESVLGYWKRMAEHEEMRPLAMVAKDILGLASSSASVERLFSHAGFVLGYKRGSLSAKFLSKQVMLRIWEGQGMMTADDM